MKNKIDEMKEIFIQIKNEQDEVYKQEENLNSRASQAKKTLLIYRKNKMN